MVEQVAVQQPNFMQTMSGLMQLKQQQQALQGGAADVQMRQQDAKQRAALAKVDWNKWMGEDGTLSTDKMIADKDTLSSLGDLASQVIQQGIQIKAGHLANKEHLLKLTDEQRQTWASLAGGLKNDPNVKAGNEEGQQMVKDAFTQFAQAYGMEAAKAVAPFALPVMNNKIPGDKLSSMLEHAQMQTLDTQRQLDLTKPQPTFVQGKEGWQGVETNAYAPGGVGTKVGPSVEQGIAPTVGTAPNSQPGVYTNNGRTFTPTTSSQPSSQPSTGLLNQDGSHRTASQDAPPPTAPAVVQDNFNKAVTVANDHIQNVRDADEHYRTSIDVSNKIRTLSKDTLTGPLPTWVKERTGSTNIQELGAYLERQATLLQTSMNLPHTNQGSDIAKDISGKTSYTPKAIQEKNDFNQSLVEGFHAYRKGLERVGGLSGNASPVAVNQFKSAWAEAFDPNVFRAKAAYARSAEEGRAFIKTLSAQDAAKMLQDKKALESLSQGKTAE